MPFFKGLQITDWVVDVVFPSTLLTSPKDKITVHYIKLTKTNQLTNIVLKSKGVRDFFWTN